MQYYLQIEENFKITVKTYLEIEEKKNEISTI